MIVNREAGPEAIIESRSNSSFRVTVSGIREKGKHEGGREVP